jgi:hypothetical protein
MHADHDRDISCECGKAPVLATFLRSMRNVESEISSGLRFRTRCPARRTRKRSRYASIAVFRIKTNVLSAKEPHLHPMLRRCL